jgi:hypothetical protein
MPTTSPPPGTVEPQQQPIANAAAVAIANEFVAHAAAEAAASANVPRPGSDDAAEIRERSISDE